MKQRGFITLRNAKTIIPVPLEKQRKIVLPFSFPLSAKVAKILYKYDKVGFLLSLKDNESLEIWEDDLFANRKGYYSVYNSTYIFQGIKRKEDIIYVSVEKLNNA
jgi:hypothetical protein